MPPIRVTLATDARTTKTSVPGANVVLGRSDLATFWLRCADRIDAAVVAYAMLVALAVALLGAPERTEANARAGTGLSQYEGFRRGRDS